MENVLLPFQEQIQSILFAMAGIVKDAGLSIEEFKKLL